MQALLKSPQKPRAGRSRPHNKRHRIWTGQITGRYRKITVHQLALAWWLFQDKHITKRQLRIYFAAHEMAEKRRYTKEDTDSRSSGGADSRRRKPSYTLDEIRRFIGGQTSPKAQAALRADLKALGRLGLVSITQHNIEFAVSIDQICLEDVSGFWAFFEQIPNQRRSIPVPRRTCRALAGGFPTSVMAMMIALLIRTLFWHRDGGEEGQGGYSIDGRTKCSWVSQVFGISRRSVTDARARLIELGWITPLEVNQWQLNTWGQRYKLNVDAFGPQVETNKPQTTEEPGGRAVGGGSEAHPKSASPTADNTPQSASPCLNKFTPSTKEALNTRRPAPMRAEPSGVSLETRGGSRKKENQIDRRAPNLNDISVGDLRNTERLLELYRQAVGRGLISGSEAGRLDFLALAERARAHGQSPPRLFAWLLREKRFEFITMADEEAAAARLRELQNGPSQQSRGGNPLTITPKPKLLELTEDERFVQVCIQVGKQHRRDPFSIARHAKQWTLEHWEATYMTYRQKEMDQWRSDDE